MKLGVMFYRFGALGLLFAPGVFFEEPLKTYLAQNHSALTTLLLLYCFPALVGVTFLMITEPVFRKFDIRFVLLFKTLCGLTVCWLILWWFIWASMTLPASPDLVLKYMVFLNVAAVGASLGIYFWAWRTPQLEISMLRFMMAAGWTITYTCAMNIHLQPTLRHFMGPGVGGLLIILGALFISRELKS